MALSELNLSARAYDRILKVARTIADLAEAEKVDATHLSEAIQLSDARPAGVGLGATDSNNFKPRWPARLVTSPTALKLVSVFLRCRLQRLSSV